ncbi:MAG TPA: adenylate/guanylate cyclase domain-containing protein [Candidatus Limnocylindria bacterium]|nr:adenylate/guanylate cyclase domain-containing protein [Candidatus Limnocylindria bacterium]
MTADGSTDRGAELSAGSATYRCFLFADLRGYTSFIEQAGNAAGVELLDDYLAIARAAVAEHRGAEIKVEGDGFHAVFPSASSAVTSGLAIVASAEAANRARPERPLRVAVGIHAGEAVETADGFIGSAVNIASRVCATAAAGEVLVTGTVRGITQASIPVDFVARGRARLKGITEPVELFSVVPSGSALPARSRRLARGPVAAVVGLVVVAALAALSLNLVGRPPAPSAPPASPGQPARIGALPLGEHAASDFEHPFSFVIADQGRTLFRHGEAGVGLLHEGDVRGRLDVARIEALYTDPCQPEGAALSGSTPEDLVIALSNVPFLEMEVAEPVKIGEQAGLSVDLTVDAGAQAACSGFGTGEVALFGTGDEQWRADPDERFRLQAFQVDGRTIAIVLSIDASPVGSVPAAETFYELAGRVTDTFRF